MNPERPTAYLGILYDRIVRSKAYRERDPLEVIEEFAKMARTEKRIDDKLYDIIQDVIRLPVDTRIKPWKSTGFGNMWFLEYERRAYIRLTKYLNESGRRGRFDFQDIGYQWEPYRDMVGYEGF